MENVCPTRDVKPVVELFDVVHHLLCTLSCWYPPRAANSSHSSLSAGLQRRHCDNCVIWTGFVRLVLVDDDAFPMVVMISGSPPWPQQLSRIRGTHTNFASASDSSILRNCGCPFHASLQLAFRAHVLQRSACLMLLFLHGLHCPNLVL